MQHDPATFDFVIVGSGFGGSVSAMRLAERGYRVLVLERGKRFRDEDFARTTWNLRRYFWAPWMRCFGILQLSPFRDVWVLHGSGVGGGSLGYANVLMEPSDALFAAPAWRHLADWKTVLAPHFATARRMLGVATNPKLWPADALLADVARSLGMNGPSPTPVGTFFGDPDKEVPDPYFGGAGPARRGCTHCGACMVGCRHNAKNTLPKNYLYFAERFGAEVRAECEVRDIRPLGPSEPDGARFVVSYRSSTAILARHPREVRAGNVIVAAGALGSLRLLFRCRDQTRSLPALSPRLGDAVRTNSEAILGSVSRDRTTDYSRGIAITSYLQADPITTIEPVRYPAGSSSMRFLGGPLVEGRTITGRIVKAIVHLVRHPADFMRTHVTPGWAERSTVLLVMQTIDNRVRLRLGRAWTTAFRRNLVSSPDPTGEARASFDIGRRVTGEFATRSNGILTGSINEGLFGIPLTAHILGGCPMGRDASEGVVDINCAVHGYPGLFVIDGSIVPANPGVNPSLTITALAEYAMSRLLADTPVTNRDLQDGNEPLFLRTAARNGRKNGGLERIKAD